MTDPAIDSRLNAISSSLYRVAVKAVIIANHKILLVKEADDEWWSLPGGGIDHGETPVEGLKRELMEELGVESKDVLTDGKVIYATAGAVTGGIPRANLFFRAEIPAGKIHPTEDVEKSAWFSIDELYDEYLSPSSGDITGWITTLLK